MKNNIDMKCHICNSKLETIEVFNGIEGNKFFIKCTGCKLESAICNSAEYALTDYEKVDVNNNKKVATIINGSPRKKNTHKALEVYYAYLKDRLGIDYSCYHQIPRMMHGCFNCPECIERCRSLDGFQHILDSISKSDVVILGTPVYLGMPTAQTVAFLTRLNCMSESTGREFFKNKEIYLLATSYCSGTKRVLGTMIQACEMLGFIIPPRSTREWSEIWRDNKLRGGLDSKKYAVYIG